MTMIEFGGAVAIVVGALVVLGAAFGIGWIVWKDVSGK